MLQLICYNILHVLTAIILCIDINEYSFSYGLSGATRDLLVAANITGVPCLFLAHLTLFR